MEITKIFFDMDGVLADFDRGVADICKLTPGPQDEVPVEEEERMWAAIKEAGHFYAKLELIPGARELFRAVYAKYGEKCEILTGIPKPKRGIDTAAEDKTDWMNRLTDSLNLPRIAVNAVSKERKRLFCKDASCVLIDDYPRNIADWRDCGGTGLLFKDSASAETALKELGIL